MLLFKLIFFIFVAVSLFLIFKIYRAEYKARKELFNYIRKYHRITIDTRRITYGKEQDEKE